MVERVAITGAKGKIGTVLTEGLQPHFDITALDLPETDIREYQQLLPKISAPPHKGIIHLAWNTQTENFRNRKTDTHNLVQFKNVYKAALEAGIPRVIMASSVHADRFDNWQDSELMSPHKIPTPDSPYGASKVYMEAMGRYYATEGLEVVCIRFGGVTAQNEPATEPSHERAVWFSHRDCVSLVHTILQANEIPDNFVVLYGISDNPGRVQNLINPFGWRPRDSAKTLK